MSTPNVHMSIIVDKGSPLDYHQFRHTAFWIRFPDGSPALKVHIIGTAGMFEFEVREESDPTAGQNFAKMIDVGYLAMSSDTSTSVKRVFERVPIDNQSREFNCQSWIERALRLLVSWGYLSQTDYDAGLDGMVDAIAEAEDEEE